MQIRRSPFWGEDHSIAISLPWKAKASSNADEGLEVVAERKQNYKIVASELSRYPHTTHQRRTAATARTWLCNLMVLEIPGCLSLAQQASMLLAGRMHYSKNMVLGIL